MMTTMVILCHSYWIYPCQMCMFVLGKKKKIAVFPVSRPTLVWTPWPYIFYYGSTNKLHKEAPTFSVQRVQSLNWFYTAIKETKRVYFHLELCRGYHREICWQLAKWRYRKYRNCYNNTGSGQTRCISGIGRKKERKKTILPTDRPYFFGEG